ncbi:CLUMA_CG019763, isoform A [Clunio marinus]|uniref:CLUMA_CG019763, isoform A n=1 Tax=Clunio marinus TaxID=568069 RepID=A0A1J1J6W9_9DIPT|nr:CLUMA_CG019763, isoform A [Clunio marinus]
MVVSVSHIASIDIVTIVDINDVKIEDNKLLLYMLLPAICPSIFIIKRVLRWWNEMMNEMSRV